MKFFVLSTLLIAGGAIATPVMLAAAPTAGADPKNESTEDKAAACQELVSGIQKNLNIQKKELAGAKALQTATGDDFKTEQQKVIKIQQQGIDIRANNQKLAAQVNSSAVAGLKTVQGAQKTEIQQVKSLTGDAASDKATLAKLITEVEDGTKQNQANLAAVKKDCK